MNEDAEESDEDNEIPVFNLEVSCWSLFSFLIFTFFFKLFLLEKRNLTFHSSCWISILSHRSDKLYIYIYLFVHLFRMIKMRTRMKRMTMMIMTLMMILSILVLQQKVRLLAESTQTHFFDYDHVWNFVNAFFDAVV